jgi:phage baseplate assembly protein W
MAVGKIFSGFTTVGVADITQTKLYDTNLIKQDLLNHFSIRRGEKLENPNFGTIIPWLLFEPFTDEIEQAIEDDVEQIFSYDPRVQLEVVEVIKDEDRHTITVNCQVFFIPFNSNDTISWEFLEDGTIRML